MNLTGLTLFTKSKPTGRSTISVLSLLSDKELIEVSAQRKLVILPSPRVTSLDAEALLDQACFPIAELLEPEAPNSYVSFGIIKTAIDEILPIYRIINK